MPMELEDPGQQPQEPQGPPEQRQLTIDLDEVPDDDAAEEKGKQQAQPGDRRARREAGRDFRRQKQDYETRLQSLQTEIAELRGRVSVPAPAAPASAPAAGADPLEAELSSIETQKAAIITAIETLPRNDPRVAELSAVWQKLQDRRDDIRDEKRESKKHKSGPSDDQQRVKNIQLTLEAEFPQVYSDEELRLRAQAEFAGLIKRGKPDGLATAREACQRALGKAGLGRPTPGPTDLERSRYSGIPSRAGANGGGAGNQWTPNRFETATALAFTKHMSHLSDEERIRFWAKKTGHSPRQAG